MQTYHIIIMLSLLYWSISGALMGMIIRFDKKTFAEHPILSFLMCLYLGPVWWAVFVVRAIQARSFLHD